MVSWRPDDEWYEAKADREEVRVDRSFDGCTSYDWTLKEGGVRDASLEAGRGADGNSVPAPPSLSDWSQPDPVVSGLRAELRTLTDILDEIVERAA